ncbi:MAG: thiamine phosphate synthase [Cytophagales bacterium]|nr:thiamine phosphate synthase [Cytophagales bacterium]
MISRLHYISQDLPEKDHATLITEACEAGVRWVQLRLKDLPKKEVKAIASDVRQICNEFQATFILNDHVKIAAAVEADGVHIGKKDMPPAEAREILGEDIIIGGTANTLEDIRRLNKSGVNYIGLGPLRYTSTKAQLSPVLGIEGYRHLIGHAKSEGNKLPIIAIGSVQLKDINDLLDAGVYGIAVASLINKAEDKEAIVNNALQRLAPDIPAPQTMMNL